jgi:hypothetical protein
MRAGRVGELVPARRQLVFSARAGLLAQWELLAARTRYPVSLPCDQHAHARELGGDRLVKADGGEWPAVAPAVLIAVDARTGPAKAVPGRAGRNDFLVCRLLKQSVRRRADRAEAARGGARRRRRAGEMQRPGFGWCGPARRGPAGHPPPRYSLRGVRRAVRRGVVQCAGGASRIHALCATLRPEFNNRSSLDIGRPNV